MSEFRTFQYRPSHTLTERDGEWWEDQRVYHALVSYQERLSLCLAFEGLGAQGSHLSE